MITTRIPCWKLCYKLDWQRWTIMDCRRSNMEPGSQASRWIWWRAGHVCRTNLETWWAVTGAAGIVKLLSGFDSYCIYLYFIYFLVPIHPSHLVCVRVFVWRAELVLCISIFVQSFTSAEAGSEIFSQQSTKCSRKTTSNQLDLRHVFHPHSTMTVHDYDILIFYNKCIQMRVLSQLVKCYNLGTCWNWCSNGLQHDATMDCSSTRHTFQATYQQCSNDFGYSDTHAPRRVLTKLSKGSGSFLGCIDWIPPRLQKPMIGYKLYQIIINYTYRFITAIEFRVEMFTLRVSYVNICKQPKNYQSISSICIAPRGDSTCYFTILKQLMHIVWGAWWCMRRMRSLSRRILPWSIHLGGDLVKSWPPLLMKIVDPKMITVCIVWKQQPFIWNDPPELRPHRSATFFLL